MERSNPALYRVEVIVEGTTKEDTGDTPKASEETQYLNVVTPGDNAFGVSDIVLRQKFKDSEGRTSRLIRIESIHHKGPVIVETIVYSMPPPENASCSTDEDASNPFSLKSTPEET